MKPFFFIFIVATIVSAVAPGNSVFSQETDNYYELHKKWNDYYRKNPELLEVEDGDFQQFVRWQEFWKNRVDCDDSLYRGKLTNFKRVWEQWRQSQSYLVSSVNPNHWSFCGPLNVTSQNNGLVSAVYVDTISSPNYQIIYAGTNASGIWKTTDGGQNWSNITDASGFNFIGVTDIKGDPYDSSIIYATTAGGGYFSESPWGIGILRSTDAGATWNSIYSVSPEQQVLSNCILVDPTNPTRLYAGIDEKVIRFQLNGNTWSQTLLFDNHDPSNDHDYRYISILKTIS